jgi:lysophospholipase L1-like esterase
MNWETYLALGDSITIGARTYLGYPEIAGAILEETLSKQWNIVNLAVSGFTGIELVRHIDTNYCNLKEQKSSITSILIGTNDVKLGTTLEDFEVALKQIIIKAKVLTQNANVLLIQIPELQKGIMYPYNIEMNSKVVEFNQSIVSLAEKYQLKTLALTVNQEHFLDGVHLNQDGVKTVAKQISNFILSERGF